MKIYTQEEIEEKNQHKVVSNVAVLEQSGNLGELAPIIKKVDEVGEIIESTEIKKVGFVAIGADKIHRNLLGSNQEKKEIESDDVKSLIVRNNSLLPAINDKEESLAVINDVILPAKNDLDLDLKIVDQKTEPVGKVLEPSIDSLKIGATISAKSDIGSFRDELLKDANNNVDNSDNISVDDNEQIPVVSDQTESQVSVNNDPGYLNTAMNAGTGNASISDIISSPDAQISLNKALEANKIVNQPVAVSEDVPPVASFSPPPAPVDVQNGSGSAIRIEETFTPEQMNKMKHKKATIISITVFVLIVFGALGYVFGWPLLKTFLNGM